MRGSDAATSLLAQIGLSSEGDPRMDGADYNIAVARFQLLAREQFNLDDLAFEVARRSSLADLGLVGYAMLTAPTMGDAFRTGLIVNRRLGASTNWEIIVERDSVRIRFSVSGALTVYASPYLEQWMATAWTMQRQLRPELARGELTGVEIGYDPGPRRRLYQSFYKSALNFDSQFSQFIYTPDLLSFPIAAANLAANEVLSKRCEELLLPTAHDSGLANTLRRQFALRGPHDRLSLEEAAKSLATSPRTLRRRLAEHGTSFKSIENEVRMSTARDYLKHTDISVDEISHLLGYSQTSAFYRAFKNWFGMSPSRLRYEDKTIGRVPTIDKS